VRAGSVGTGSWSRSSRCSRRQTAIAISRCGTAHGKDVDHAGMPEVPPLPGPDRTVFCAAFQANSVDAALSPAVSWQFAWPGSSMSSSVRCRCKAATRFARAPSSRRRRGWGTNVRGLTGQRHAAPPTGADPRTMTASSFTVHPASLPDRRALRNGGRSSTLARRIEAVARRMAARCAPCPLARAGRPRCGARSPQARHPRRLRDPRLLGGRRRVRQRHRQRRLAALPA
jgi:hypothetical protein